MQACLGGVVLAGQQLSFPQEHLRGQSVNHSDCEDSAVTGHGGHHMQRRGQLMIEYSVGVSPIDV